MSTRGIIAEPYGDGFKGVYHHWDSYPEGLGKTLFDLRNGFFKGNIPAMKKFLIHDHTAGWSTINDRDFNKPAGFVEFQDRKDSITNGPECYCHGSRHEPDMIFTNNDDTWAEWAYVIGDTGVISIYYRQDKEWRFLAQVTDIEPNWDVYSQSVNLMREAKDNS